MSALHAPLSLFRITCLSITGIVLYILWFSFRDQRGQRRDRSFLTPDSHLPFSKSTNFDSCTVQLGLPQDTRAGTERLDLTVSQCHTFFPNLTTMLKANIQHGTFAFHPSNPDYTGLVQARIKNSHLYILTEARNPTSEVLLQRTAVLSQIHRALVTWPTGEKVPDTVFASVTNDVPKNNSWVFARPNKVANSEGVEGNYWLMPHFGFWAWGSAAKELGTMDDVLRRIDAVEQSVSEEVREKKGKEGWDGKIDKVVWRGTPWFNPLAYPLLRQDLVKVTKERDWADVEALQREDAGGYKNALKIEDFCRYKYVMYTEGVTYSGRLAYHMACESVLISAPLTWLTHTAFLLKPIYAEDLLAQFNFDIPFDTTKGKRSYRPRMPPLLATTTDYRKANMVYVSPSFDNLEAVIMFLRAHPEVGKVIVENLRESARRYLSSAAETCYWRALLRGWSAAVLPEGSWGEYGEGVLFEEWVLAKVMGA